MNQEFLKDERYIKVNNFCGEITDSSCKTCPLLRLNLCNINDENLSSWDEDEETLEKAYRMLVRNGHITENDKDDVVNHPNHYNANAMECIDEMVLVFGKQAVINFCKCNAWKYRYRSEHKNGSEDLKKADWYIAKIKELEGSE